MTALTSVPQHSSNSNNNNNNNNNDAELVSQPTRDDKSTAQALRAVVAVDGSHREVRATGNGDTSRLQQPTDRVPIQRLSLRSSVHNAAQTTSASSAAVSVNDSGDGDGDSSSSSNTRRRQRRKLDACTDGQSLDAQNANANATTDITLAIGTYFDVARYLQHHINDYTQQNPHVHIRIQPVNGSIVEFQDYLILQNSQWDAAILPSQSIGALVESNALFDITQYVRAPVRADGAGMNDSSDDKDTADDNIFERTASATANSLDWQDILPFVKHHITQYNRRTYMIPLDGDALQLFYRADLFQKYNRTVPRTWEEYSQVAKFFTQLEQEPDIYGSCISRSRRCSNAYWINMILATITQTQGTQSGFLIDPHDESLRPLMGAAMRLALRHIAEQIVYGHPQELDTSTSCLSTNFLFNRGQCAMTINWGDQLRGLQSAPFRVGVAPTPGSTRYYHRASSQLRDCTVQNCPYAEYDAQQDRLVNAPPFAAFGGWSAAVSAQTSQSAATLDFLAFLSNSRQSFSDVLPNLRSNFIQPYRYSHLGIDSDKVTFSVTNSWIEQGNYDPQLIQDYSNTILNLNSPNLAVELRIPEALELRGVLDAEVTNYIELLAEAVELGVELDDDASIELLANVTKRIEDRIRAVIFTLDQRVYRPSIPTLVNDTTSTSVLQVAATAPTPPAFVNNPFLVSYQKSLGIFVSPPEQNNYIVSSYRFAGWGLSGLICGSAIICAIIAITSSRHRVIRAWQPFTLVQCCAGLFLMGATIALVSLDESLVSDSILNTTCMLMPWTYIIGFTLLFSAVYAKITRCREVISARQTPSTIAVDWEATLQLTIRFLGVNAIILTIWTVTDPLKWVREEVPSNDSTSVSPLYQMEDTYGACRGSFYTSIMCAVLLFAFNIILCTTGIVQGLQSRRLGFEFKENHWLPLILFPFAESWIITAPTLFLVEADPTGTFVVLTCMITVSTMGSLLSLFAPIEWYIRKYENDHDVEKQKVTTSFNKEQEIKEYKRKIQMVTHDNDRIQKEIAKLRSRFREADDDDDDDGDCNAADASNDAAKVPKTQARGFQFATDRKLAVPTSQETIVTSWKTDRSTPYTPLQSASRDLDDRLVMKDVDDDDDGGSKPDHETWLDRPESHPMSLSSTEPLNDDGGLPISSPALLVDGKALLPSKEATDMDMHEKKGDAGDSGVVELRSPILQQESLRSRAPRDIGLPAPLSGSSSAADESMPVFEDSPASTPSRPNKRDEGAALTAHSNQRSMMTAETQSSGPSSTTIESHLSEEGPRQTDKIRRHLDLSGNVTSSDEDSAVGAHDCIDEGSVRRDDDNVSNADSQPKDDNAKLEAALKSDNVGAISAAVAMLISAIKGSPSYSAVSPCPEESDEEHEKGTTKRTLDFSSHEADDASKDTKPMSLDHSENLVTDEESRADSVRMDIQDKDDEDEEAPKSFRDQSTTGESSGADDQLDETETKDASPTDGASTNSPITMQDAGEPSKGDTFTAVKLDNLNGLQGFADAFDGPSKSIFSQPRTIAVDHDLRNSQFNSSPKHGNEMGKTHSFTVGDWSAVGAMASVLADTSDSQSCSSLGSYTTESSATSMGATHAASQLETPLAKELDLLVGNKDWDGVKRAAQKFEVSKQSKPLRRSSLGDRRRRRRVAETMRYTASTKHETNGAK